MFEIWILIFFIFFLFIYNACFLIEGFDPHEDADNPWKDPPQGPTADREDVEAPPLSAPPNKEIEDIIPEYTDPLKPNCECFDTQTEKFLARNEQAYGQLEEDIKIIKEKIKQASKQVGLNEGAIEQNKQYDLAICCATGKEDACANLNEYDCSELLK